MIAGYVEPDIEVWYAAASLRAHPRFRFEERVKDVPADNVIRVCFLLKFCVTKLLQNRAS